MADYDEISEATPYKKRKLNDGKGWNSQEDSGEELTEEDFHTVATLPLPSTQQRQLQYTKEQFHSDLDTDNHTFITQPTQTLNLNTQPQLYEDTLPNTSDVLVEQSSPTRAPSPPKEPPPPIRRAFSRPAGFLASTMAPPGTSFRAPLGVQAKAQPPVIDLDSDDDPPVHHSSDEGEAAREMTSTLKPTVFKKSGRALDSESSNIVKESPRAASGSVDTFKNLLSEFRHDSSDMASAYGSSSRRPRPQQSFVSRPNLVAPEPKTAIYKTLDDVHDSRFKAKVLEIKQVLDYESVQRCMDALQECHGNPQDAMNWLMADGEKDASGEDVDELASMSPVAKRGVAMTKSVQDSSQPMRRNMAKQEVRAEQTIAERYNATQGGRRPSQRTELQSPTSPEDVKPVPRRRLQQGRKLHRSPSPELSPVQKPLQQRPKKKDVIVLDDSDSDSGVEETEATPEPKVSPESTFDRRLLKFFNECSLADLVDLTAQQPEVIQTVLDQRPFDSLDVIRTISDKPEATKSGKRSKARPVGDRIVDICIEMWTGYDAVDELVEECERIAKPIQEALKSWGTGSATNSVGELHLLSLDETHDSGIGTPSSSVPDRDTSVSPALRPNVKGKFLGQPESMNSEITLKDFQLVGLNWLNLLWTKRETAQGCILADEMGLGKTCQVIAFLAHLQQYNFERVHLVIVPGSTLENWLREFERFAPNLNVVPYYGKQSERAELRDGIANDYDSIDVVVTTYDMAQKPLDNKFIRQLEPLVCVFDEAHALRNTQTDRYKQLMRIPAEFRLLLTGTPLQNNLRELVAILAFIMPQLFREKQDALEYIFQHKASTKDTSHSALLSTERIARARTMMTPFILRRKKQQVLELPAKHSRVEYCDMTASQASHYAQVLQEAQDHYAGPAAGRKSKKSATNILMALRKAAIHALLSRNFYDDDKIDKMVEVLRKHPEFSENTPERIKQYLTGEHHQSFKGGDYGLHRFCVEREYLRKFRLKSRQLMDSSGKVNRFRELVQAFAANGDRVLVFSQFTSMMDILESVLGEIDIKFMRLDGSTDIQSRQTMLDQFANDESIPVFMLSTKAGGAGINLACANKVIIFDSGFNPQDDVQAENRAHRVGQTREVEVVRLVTRGTIEEQIHALGESKLALDERVAGEGAKAEAADDVRAEEAGKQMVEKMFLDSLKKEDESEKKVKVENGSGGDDLKDAFKSGLENAGLNVASKQARF